MMDDEAEKYKREVQNILHNAMSSIDRMNRPNSGSATATRATHPITVRTSSSSSGIRATRPSGADTTSSFLSRAQENFRYGLW